MARFVGRASPSSRSGDRATECPPFDAVVTEAVAHDEQLPEVRIASPGVLRNPRVSVRFLDQIIALSTIIFLRRDENAHRRFETLDIKVALRSLELHQVKRSQIARCVIEEEIFRAWVRRILTARAFAGVPFVDRGSNCIPGSPRLYVSSAILRVERAFLRSHRLPIYFHGASTVHQPSSAACIHS